ncbi:hypothetical protein N0V93_004146 [Gnomoniopsis smithogilvyi]|uniref:Coupling of ubiquitin conjugation to ER degradation protein 1 n=1 Tax=Gnomoniopsis smithogilvyi TaxID=1191159 RepID=A0A9W8YT64_9PEZI|nr:hypothetical protein N0V93_004146 [Gnomoniopsis smithogilvyi]
MSNEISIPTLVVVVVLGGLVFKYLFWPSNASPGTSGQGRDSLSQQRQREAAVERIQQMFPQVERRTILWDLQRNGGSIAATTEKILSGTIQAPPITFQPPPPPGSNTASSTSGSSTSAKPADKPAQPNLIQRYNLQDKLKEQSEADAAAADAAAKKWSTNKDERQTLLQKRRDEMILQARRKMEAKVAAEKAAAEEAS